MIQLSQQLKRALAYCILTDTKSIKDRLRSAAVKALISISLKLPHRPAEDVALTLGILGILRAIGELRFNQPTSPPQHEDANL